VSAFHAILLGIIQGLTEFLPISSTAHLTFTGKLLGFIDAQHPEAWTEFIAVMQLGTITAVILYFRQDIIKMTVSVLSDLKEKGLNYRSYSIETWLAFFIVIGTLPVALIGYSLKNLIEGSLTKTTLVIIGSLIALAALLWLAEKLSARKKGLESLSWKDALIIGCAQALALIPGASRSGTTMTAALFLGFDRTTAARFSFLLSIPAVLASGLFELARIKSSVFSLGTGNLVIATLVSGVAGYATIAWLLRYLMKHSMMIFVWYRFALGLVLTVLLLIGIISP
jgi:undecaprenyl-diphosphatase